MRIRLCITGLKDIASRCCLCLVLTAPLSQGASVLFDNGDPGFGNGFVSDPGYPIQYGNDFTFSGPATIKGISWFGSYKMPTPTSSNVVGPDNFSIQIFTTDRGAPSMTPLWSLTGLAASRSDTGTGLPFPGTEMYSYGLSTPAISLQGGTYLLSIINQTTPGDNWWLWSWSNQSFQPNKAIYFRAGDGDAWTGPFTTQVSFKLLGDDSPSDPIGESPVPEPRISELATFGLLGALCTRKFLTRRAV